jgi:PilZ domain-containing protein
MTTPPLRVERRVGQRFPYLLAVSLREPATSIEGVGVTQDLSSRGVFFFTDVQLAEGAEIELTLRMPSEITLGESMPVRCRARVLRIVRPNGGPSGTLGAEPKIGVAVRLENYEYLSMSSESSANFARISTLHPDRAEERSTVHSTARPTVD